MRIQWKKEWTTPALVGVGSFAVGGAVGYFVALKRINDNLEVIFDAERDIIGHVDSIEETPEGLVVTGEIYPESAIKIMTPLEKEFEKHTLPVPASEDLDMIDPEEQGYVEEQIDEAFLPSQAVEACQIEDVQQNEMLKIVEGLPMEEEEKNTKEGIRNIFYTDPNWDQVDEDSRRSEDAPYILHETEYFRNENGYQQQSLTYYEGDDILVDERDVPIYGYDKYTGPLTFGKGTNDPNSVYIRNDKMKAEYEVSRHPGHYQIEIMGLHEEEKLDDDELRHSQQITRFRMD